MSAELRAAGLSEHAANNAHLLGLPPGTILGIITKYGPIALQILEELLAGLGKAPTA